MSQPKVLGPAATMGATAAALPVTGSPVVTLFVVGAVMVVAGLLLIRASRLRRDPF